MGILWSKRIGSESEIPVAKAQGFDAVEPSLSALAELDAEGLSSFEERLKESRLGCEVFASILPADVAVTERGFNIYSWTEYLRAALDRAARLGCRRLLWNEGKARILPIEGETSIFKEHFNQFLFMLCDIGEQHGMEICLEPLGPRRTNFINSLPEALQVIDSVDKPNLAIALSSSAYAEIGITDEEISAFAGRIVHARVEFLRDARPGHQAADTGTLSFFGALKNIGYQGAIALPGDADEAALKACRESWR
jgi:sugar phosphate isomerase/epimerase